MSEFGAAVERVKVYIETQRETYGETLFLADLKLITENVKETKEEQTYAIGAEQDKEKQDAIVFYQNNIGMIRPFTADEILNWITDTSDEIVIYALKKAIEQNKPTWGYAKAILQQWHNKNIHTMEQIKAAETEFRTMQENRNQYRLGGADTTDDPEWFKNKEHEMKQFVEAHKKEQPRESDDREKLNRLMAEYKEG